MPNLPLHSPIFEISTIAVLAVLFGCLQAAVRQKEVEAWDLRIGNWVISQATPGKDRLFALLTSLGKYKWIRNLAILICLWLIYERDWLRATMLVVLVGAATVISTFLQRLISRVRPNFERNFLYGVEFSFPSGHTMLATAFYLMIAYLGGVYGRGSVAGWVIVAFSIGLILLIGISRIYLGVHFLTDVLGGWIAGFLLFFIVYCIADDLPLLLNAIQR